MTGNTLMSDILLGTTPAPYSLVIVGREAVAANARVAVTGNVLRAQAELPARAAGLPPWVQLNSEEA